MPASDESAFRALLDERGLLRPDAFTPLARESSLTIFAQAADVRLDAEALKRSAARFFETQLGLTVEKQYDDREVTADVARVIVGGDDATARGTRLCYGRMADVDDVEAAERAERAAGASASGLSALARRCRVVWLVRLEAEDDRTALTIAAVFASVLLGPILAPRATNLFGVRTARLALESRSSVYR